MQCVLRDGRVLGVSKDDVLGNASRPVSAEKVLEKFEANAARSLAAVAIKQIIDFWLHIDNHSDFGLLANSLMAPRLTP